MFACVDLKDRRRNNRLQKVVTALVDAPSVSLCAASGGWAEIIATYRLLPSDYLAGNGASPGLWTGLASDTLGRVMSLPEGERATLLGRGNQDVGSVTWIKSGG